MESKSKINPIQFEANVNNKNVSVYYLRNENGIEAVFTNYGQRLISLMVPDNKGNFDDIVLGYSSLEEYINNSQSYFGAVIGRYANRIAQGKFSINNEEFKLRNNNGTHHLHGGDMGFHNVVWDAEQLSQNSVKFYRNSPDMEEGYPGNLKIKVLYTLTDTDELRISYKAETDKITPVNLTHHSFFNLKGEGNGTIEDHLFTMNADHFTPVDEHLIPTGEIRSVTSTPFDFRTKKNIRLGDIPKNQQLLFGNGYDHNLVLNDKRQSKGELIFAAKVEEPNSGRVLEVYTDKPGMQFFTVNSLHVQKGKSEKPYISKGAFCLETQFFPDSPNQPGFPDSLLNPGELYTSNTIYKFSTNQYF